MLVLKIKKVLFNVTVGGFIMLHQPPLKVHHVQLLKAVENDSRGFPPFFVRFQKVTLPQVTTDVSVTTTAE